MVGSIEYEVTRLFMKSEIRQNVQREQVAQDKRNIQKQNKMQLQSNTSAKRQPVRVIKSGNDLCPCGSGKNSKLSWKKA